MFIYTSGPWCSGCEKVCLCHLFKQVPNQAVTEVLMECCCHPHVMSFLVKNHKNRNLHSREVLKNPSFSNQVCFLQMKTREKG